MTGVGQKSGRVLDVLQRLVACDTQNPPRALSLDSTIFEIIRQSLPGFEFSLQDFGQGRLNLFAVRGQPTTLFNVHLDTVPVGDNWTLPALQLTARNGRVHGRGTCDIKGAAACLIVAANSTTHDVALLFSTDEEGAASCCVERFCHSPEQSQFQHFVVAEPTGSNAVIGHRGYLSVRGEFTGTAGHTSQFEQLKQSATHAATRWAVSALDQVEAFEEHELGNQSCCFNLGRVEGGIKNNMIADRCMVSWSARMPSGFSNQKLLAKLGLDSDGTSIDNPDWQTTFDGAPFPTTTKTRELSADWCAELGLDIAEDVNFWTEAAIFGRLERPTIVLGPGDIAQAHSADEWVAVEQLELCTREYQKIMYHQPLSRHENA